MENVGSYKKISLMISSQRFYEIFTWLISRIIKRKKYKIMSMKKKQQQCCIYGSRKPHGKYCGICIEHIYTGCTL